MDTLQAMEKRKSVRSYKKEQITDEALSAVLKAGQSAPNAGPFQISVIQHGDLLRRISKDAKDGMLNSGIEFLMQRAALPGYDPIYGAPTLILLSAPDDNPYSVANTSLAAENIILAATSLGLGSCYIVSASRAFTGENGGALAAEAGIPSGYSFKCGVILGYEAGEAFSSPMTVEIGVNYVK
jgi:FMN reductase [NAD(P)H]